MLTDGVLFASALCQALLVATYELCDLQRSRELDHKPRRWFFRQPAAYQFASTHLLISFTAFWGIRLAVDRIVEFVCPTTPLKLVLPVLMTIIAPGIYLMLVYSQLLPGRRPRRWYLYAGLRGAFDLLRGPFEKRLRESLRTQANANAARARQVLDEVDEGLRIAAVERAWQSLLRDLPDGRSKDHAQGQFDRFERDFRDKGGSFVNTYILALLGLISRYAAEEDDILRYLKRGLAQSSAGDGRAETSRSERDAVAAEPDPELKAQVAAALKGVQVHSGGEVRHADAALQPDAVVSALEEIKTTLRIAAQFRDLVAAIKQKEAPPVSTLIRCHAGGVDIVCDGQETRIGLAQFAMDPWLASSIAREAANKRVADVWRQINQTYGGSAGCTVDERARLGIVMDGMKTALCFDLRRLLKIYEETLGIELRDGCGLDDVC